MTTLNIDYDQLFAYRIFLQDEERYEEEKDIINLLRLELINMGVPNEDVPNHLKIFYEKFNINFSMDEINELLNTNYLMQEITNHLQAITYHIPINTEDEDDDDAEYEHMPPLIPISLLQNTFMELLNMPSLTNQDVVSTLKEEEFNKIKKYSTIKTLNENCSICLVNMNTKEEIWELPCSHKFHGECIETLLKNYNYKCPTCRNEVGKPTHHL